MIVDVDLQEHLPASYIDRIHRQIDFKLASMSALIREIRVSVVELDNQTQATTYECRLLAKLKDETLEEVQAIGTLNMCIADASARMGRNIGRKVQHKDAHWKRAARS